MAHAPATHTPPHHGEHHGDPAAEVHETAPRKGKVRTVVVARPESFEQSIYVPAIIKGVGITMAHFFKNLFGSKEVKQIVTFEYPEVKLKYTERYRGLHRLMKREDGEVRCVACMCCPTVCPAHCITIVAEETGNGNEKRPKIFEIDELRCIACGLCVEACPCDAIRMDTGVHMPPTEKRYEAVLGKNDLLSRGAASSAEQGGLGANWRDRTNFKLPIAP